MKNKRDLLNSEKNIYYKSLFHFRLVESYMKCNLRKTKKVLTIYYIQTFYHIWFSTPGLEILGDAIVPLKDWMSRKNTKKEKYRFVERAF